MWTQAISFTAKRRHEIRGLSRLAFGLALVVGVTFTACTSEQVDGPTPQPERFISVSSGYYHSCALKSTGEAVCWGANYSGEASPPDERFVEISAGASFTCAISEDASVKCWGNIRYDDRSLDDEFVASFSEDGDMCTVRGDGSEKCWNYVVNAELGVADLPEWGQGYISNVQDDGSICSDIGNRDQFCWARIKFTERSPPTDLKFVAISSGNSHVCGLLESGSPRCWGSRWAEVPAELQDDNFVAITSGYDFTCAVRDDDSDICWGLAEGEPAKKLSNDFISISGGFLDACGLKARGTIICWHKLDGDLYVPVDKKRFEYLGSHIGEHGSSDYRCAIDSDRQAVCWSSPYRRRGIDAELIPSEKGFLEVSTGPYHACGLYTDGSITCWGDNSGGQTTHPTLASATPMPQVTRDCFVGQILQKGSGCKVEKGFDGPYMFVVNENGRGDLYNVDLKLISTHYNDLHISYSVVNGHERTYTTLRASHKNNGSWIIEEVHP